MKFITTYKKAVNWLNPSLILCNEIANIDSSIWENARFDMWDENGNPKELFMFFLTSLSEGDVCFLEQHFEGLLFTYSEKLDLYILCVDHYGTAWDCIPCCTDLEVAKEDLYKC